MKKSHSPIYLLLACLILTGLLGTITFLSLTYQATAATPAANDNNGNANADAGPPGGGGGRGRRPTMVPTAQLRFAGSDAAISPGILSPGAPMTYTFTILNDGGTMIANNATLEIPWNGDQTFVDFSSDNPDWKVKSVDSTELFIDLGNVAIGETGKITIHATFANNYLKTIFKQTVYLNWNDEHAARHAGTNLYAQVNLLPTPVAGSGATPTPTPVPTTTPDTIPTSGAFAPVATQASTDAVWYFPATQHTLSGGFLGYWKDHGSVTNLGYPISEEFQENGRTVQYFERVVMEYWPENPDPYKVLLRSIGVDLNGVDPAVSPDSPTASDGSVYYSETGHWLDGRFVDTWESMGGLAQFGFPITEPVIEGNTLIQWTERARFELDLSRPNQLVTLGLVGEEEARNKGY